jgi:hypothetical protein
VRFNRRDGKGGLQYAPSPDRCARDIAADNGLRPALRSVSADEAGKRRLDQIRQARPGILIGTGPGFWQAVVPLPNGMDVITRTSPGELADVLEQRCRSAR